MIDFNSLLNEKIKTRFFKKFLLYFISKLLYTNRINEFLKINSHLDARNFINELFESLSFSFEISNQDIQKIPAEGRVICVSNHPIGSLDGLSLLKLFLDIRSDVKILANDILLNVNNIKDYIIPVNVFDGKLNKKSFNEIKNALIEDKAVIIFPSGAVSRLKGLSIIDSKWNKGAIHFAQKFNSPILPVYINAKNSVLFYIISAINKRLSSLLLVHELFNKKNVKIKIKIGNIIPSKVFTSGNISEFYQIKLLKKHVYELKKNRPKEIFHTEKNIIHPIDRRLLKREFNSCELIGLTNEGYRLYVVDKKISPQILIELGRLRELTFRKVGEGTGKKFDLDIYDDYYKHLVIWDENNLEIVGSYRIGFANEIVTNYNTNKLYTSSLFNFSEKFKNEILPYSIELGRSFIQKKYWNSNALYYLFQGIGSIINNNNSIKYLFGPVSISNNYSQNAKEQIVFLYKKWYSKSYNLVTGKNEFIISKDVHNKLLSEYDCKDRIADFNKLKKNLKIEGYTIPILFKHYVELCEEGGANFLSFNVDPDFENCIDGFLVIEIDKIKEEKKRKYIQQIHKIKIPA
ncbi:MAG: lysophospholipid acyltransferase family protein [Stygiobacter sp.]